MSSVPGTPRSTRSILDYPEGTVFSLSHEDLGAWINSINSFFKLQGLALYPDPPYFNNLVLRADGTQILAEFEPRMELIAIGVKDFKYAIGCNGKGEATQKGTAEFYSKHSVALGTTDIYKLQVEGTTARLFHGEEQVWIGDAKEAGHGLDGTYNILL